MRWWRWKWMGLVFVLCSAHAIAQRVHKCVAPDGQVSYRDTPCEAPSREAANWDAPPEPPPVELRHSAQAPSARQRPIERTARGGGARIARTAAPSACEAARANREKTLERVGLKRTFDLLSRLDEQVRNACR